MKNILILYLFLSIFGDPREVKEAYSLYQQGNYRGCINTLLSYGKYYKNSKALALLSISYFKLGMRDSAVYYYELLKFKDKKMLSFEGVSFYAGLSYESMGEVEKAAFAYAHATYGEKERDAAILRLSSLLGIPVSRIRFLAGRGEISSLFEPGKLYVLVPQGMMYEIGEEFLRGFKLAFHGKFEVLDERSWPSINYIKNVSLLVGPLSSRNMYNLLENMERVIPVLSPVAVYLPPESLKFVYSPAKTHFYEIKKLADYLVNQLGYIYFGILYRNNAEGLQWKRLFEREIQRNQGKILFELAYNETTLPDSVFGSVDTTLLDGIFVPGGDKRALFMASRAKVSFPEVPVFGLSLWKYYFGGGTFTFENFIFASLPVSFKQVLKLNEEKENFRQKYFDLYGSRPSFIAERGYDCGKILMEIFKNDKELSPAEIILRLKSLGVYEGISSDWIFVDENPVEIYYFKKGKFYLKEVNNEER